MANIKLTIHSTLLPRKTLTATADVKSSWTDFLSLKCGVKVSHPGDYQVYSLSYGRTGRKGWKAEMDEIIETFLAQFSQKLPKYSVLICRKTRRSSLKGEVVVLNESVPIIDPEAGSNQDFVAPLSPAFKRVAPRRLLYPSLEPQTPAVDRDQMRFSGQQCRAGTPWKIKIKDRLDNVGNSLLLRVADEIKSLNDEGLWQRNVMHAPLASTFLMDLLAD